MKAGHAIVDLVLAAEADVLFVVGIGKNAGKTVTARAVYEAACERDIAVALATVGRDGEIVDALDARPKPQLHLRPGTVFATARTVLPRSPAAEILAVSNLPTAAGRLVYARVRHASRCELIGPPTASGVREAVRFLRANARLTIVDGAFDRVAAVAGENGAIVIAGGASAASTAREATDAMQALAVRLSAPRYDPSLEAVRIDGALTAARATELIGANERRQIVVRDPTQIALTGKTALHAFERLAIRCERPLRPVAATVAPAAPNGGFEPRAF
ncbi:MAG TPA: hypothetical protein VJP76_04350, partial [Candidatus Tumulicola sp.]|nr:hypothetical protein [Candidatus Tumulicola sp.]